MAIEVNDAEGTVTMTVFEYSVLQHRADRYDAHSAALIELYDLIRDDITDERREELMHEFYHHVQPFALELETFVKALQAMPLEA